MAEFNIKQDLKSRPDAESLEIICISGPRAPKNMKRLMDGERAFIGDEYGLSVSEKTVGAIIAQYGALICATPRW